MYCFDANIIIDIFRGDKDLRAKLEKIEGLVDIFVTPITLCELYNGAYLHHNPVEKLKDLENFIFNFDLLDFDDDACREFGEEYARLSKEGKMTGEFDLMIAGIAKVNGLIVVTRNKKHFESVSVKVEVW